MPHRQKPFLRGLFTLSAVAACLLAVSAPAAAQVSIVPDRTTGGGTQTFAFRMANERTDTTSTRLELVFPQVPPIAYVQVDPVPGWTVSIRPRPLDPPLRAGDRTVNEVAAALVVEGGAVQPREFEQFLVTMGPLPADGKLVFDATQTYANGAVAHWTGESAGPAITLGSGAVPGAAPGPAPVSASGAPGQQTVSVAPNVAAPHESSSSGGLPYALLWGALGVAVAVLAGVWYQARRRAARPAESSVDLFDEPERTDETEASNR
ncbi:DUF1775 domain-containing protein [Amycolatopsis sp. GM8]|uniref:DUF1775 domain-containing protein n=1 Tax=Amycolatopsis sp. GM8 TaxID=2896530 RepID=UPI001F1AD9B6|nr:DUF1775 domain-containing protein [Amycolatopsis sp. GM8]